MDVPQGKMKYRYRQGHVHDAFFARLSLNFICGPIPCCNPLVSVPGAAVSYSLLISSNELGEAMSYTNDPRQSLLNII